MSNHGNARSIRSLLLTIVLAALPAGAGAADNGFAVAEPGYRIGFPRDEGSHPQFGIEWWYVTGWLEAADGRPLGFQVTFFRSRTGVGEDNPSRFAPKQLLFAHAAVSDPRRGSLLRDERAARAGFGLAEAAEGSLDVHIDDWSMRAEGGNGYRAIVRGSQIGMDIELERTQPPLLQGDRGFSQKGPEPRWASHYYSLPQLQASGRVVIDGREHRVRGVAWFDHEWSSVIMGDKAQGWDWVGLNLDDGGALMIFRMRDPQGAEYWADATWRRAGAQGAVQRSYTREEIEWHPLRRWRSPRTGIDYPVEWQVKVGDRTLKLRPLMDDQESDSRGSTGTLYWEGAVRAFDESDRPIGRGYLELTGYGARVKL